MKFSLAFSQNEFKVVGAILVSLVLVITLNLQVAHRKGRDLQRKNDIRTIHDALWAFQAENDFFPESQNGKIVGCLADPANPPLNNEGEIIFSECDWGTGVMAGVVMPIDPDHREGASYLYFSNTSRFQIYAALEGANEAEYDEAILGRGLECGGRVCNFGWASGATPLDKSLESYENELRKQKWE